MTYNQVADDDLKYLGLEAGPVGKDFLQDLDQEMAHRCTDDGSVDCHLWHTRCEVMAILVPILSYPRRKDLLQTRESA